MSDDFGICRLNYGGPYLGYTPRGHLRWLPYGVKRLIVRGWNRTVCLFNGHVGYHDEHESVACVHCGKK